MDDVPILLYRGMSEKEYEDAKRRGYFQSGQHVYNKLMSDLADAENAGDIEEASMIRAELQSRELSGEFTYTFWADTYVNAANYGPVVVTIRTKGIENQFEPFEGRPGEWVSDEPVPFSAMHGAQLQLHRTRFDNRALRRPDVRVHRHLRRLK